MKRLLKAFRQSSKCSNIIITIGKIEINFGLFSVNDIQVNGLWGASTPPHPHRGLPPPGLRLVWILKSS